MTDAKGACDAASCATMSCRPLLLALLKSMQPFAPPELDTPPPPKAS
jgi:hypothetical protein